MPNQLKTHTVEVANKARIDRQLGLILFAQLVSGDGDQPDQFIVEGRP